MTAPACRDRPRRVRHGLCRLHPPTDASHRTPRPRTGGRKKALYTRGCVNAGWPPPEHYAIRFLNSADGFGKSTVSGPAPHPLNATPEGLEVPLWGEVFE